MKRFLYIFAHSLCFLLSAGGSFMVNAAAVRGVQPEITMTVSTRDSLYRTPLLFHFRQNRSLVEYDYMDNPRTLACFCALFTDSLSTPGIDTVTIFSYASPEGDARHNFALARQRAIAVKGYLLWKYPHLNRERLLIEPVGEDWLKLRELVVADNSVPDRGEVLHLLDEIPDRDRCKVLLKKLNCGYAYRYICKKLLPQLRNAAVCLVKLKTVQPDFAAEYDSVLNYVDYKESVASRSLTCQHNLSNQHSSSDQHSLPSDQGRISDQCGIPFQRPASCSNLLSLRRNNPPVSSPPERLRSFRPLFALKTNLLFDLAMVPNIELELPLGRHNRWSLNAEWLFPWWLIDHDKYCLQILSGGLEGRYWLGNRTTRGALAGHFLGLYAGGGKYDLQWKTDGYQGEFYIASGISYGYSAPIARRLNLEFSIGIGLLRTNYEHYHAIDDYQTLLWQNDGNYTWFGPTKIKISLVWLLGGRKGGER